MCLEGQVETITTYMPCKQMHSYATVIPYASKRQGTPQKAQGRVQCRQSQQTCRHEPHSLAVEHRAQKQAAGAWLPALVIGPMHLCEERLQRPGSNNCLSQ